MNEVTDRMVEAAMEQWMAATGDVPPDDPGRALMRAAIEAALREMPAPEPVAWMDEFGNTFPLAANKGAGSWRDEHKRNWTPLYAHPPQQRTPLTDEEIESIWRQKPRWHAPPIGTTDIEFARAVERAHGIKGGGDE